MHNVPTQHYNAAHTDPLLVPHWHYKSDVHQKVPQVLLGHILQMGTEINVLCCVFCKHKSIETNL